MCSPNTSVGLDPGSLAEWFAAVATFLAVVVALFGDWIKFKLFPPKLALSLRDKIGEKTTEVLTRQTDKGPQIRNVDARYYHVKVSNQKRWPNATQTQVFLIKVEETGPDGEFQVKWSGELPVRWKFHEVYPALRTIGPDAFCDLCSVTKEKYIRLHPLIIPNNFPPRPETATTLAISLQARGIDGESPISRFQISWDGQWEDGDTEMARHLVVKDVTKKRG